MSQIKVGIIGGSGTERALVAPSQGRPVTVDTPFGKPSDAIIELDWQGTQVAILNRHGPGHVLSPSAINYRANIYALKARRCTHVIACGAVGSLVEEIRPKDLVIPNQIIDKTFRRIPTFFDEIAVHTELASPFCQVLRKHLLDSKGAVNTTVHDGGTYVCMEGPGLSTQAESHMHRSWGAQLIGMTAMPEAKLAREAEMAYALVCLPSDYDCWRPGPENLDKQDLLAEIIGNLTEATANAIELIKDAVANFDKIADIESPAHTALSEAIWTNRSMITDQMKQNLGVIVEKYI